MLASPKARALVDNFAGQWLQIRSLETFQPDRKLFPDYDPTLRNAMQRETELFFEYVMRADRSVLEFLTGDYVRQRPTRPLLRPDRRHRRRISESLACRHRPARRAHPRQRAHAHLNPNRTSPVKRGKWVLENLLGTPPPPAPPDVPELEETAHLVTGTLRQQMEQHRQNPSCASCHARMDPIGFGLENFNAIGAWRDLDGESPVDASGKLGTTDTFNGAAELTALLAKNRRREFLGSLADKMLTYALGRGTEHYDRPAIEKIVQSVSENDDKFSALILGVTESFPFQMQRVDATAPQV